MAQFNYEEAFSRNVGWVTLDELNTLKQKKVAIGGLGGVGGSHLIVLARMVSASFIYRTWMYLSLPTSIANMGPLSAL